MKALEELAGLAQLINGLGNAVSYSWTCLIDRQLRWRGRLQREHGSGAQPGRPRGDGVGALKLGSDNLLGCRPIALEEGRPMLALIRRTRADWQSSFRISTRKSCCEESRKSTRPATLVASQAALGGSVDVRPVRQVTRSTHAIDLPRGGSSLATRTRTVHSAHSTSRRIACSESEGSRQSKRE